MKKIIDPKKIVQKYGVDTFAVIEDNVEVLIEIEGIGKKRVQMIAESWERQKEVKNIMLFLQDHQVSTSYAAKIYKQYGNDSFCSENCEAGAGEPAKLLPCGAFPDTGAYTYAARRGRSVVIKR